MHILVVDPNEPFAVLLSEELKREGYTVDTCLRGADALMLARRQHLDLTILDMALANPDAIELAQALRKTDPSMRLMLIPLMGETLSLRASEITVQGVLPKPFFLPELPELIQAALGAPKDGVASAVRAETPPAGTSAPASSAVASVPSPDANIFGPEIGVEPPIKIAPRAEAPRPPKPSETVKPARPPAPKPAHVREAPVPPVAARVPSVTPEEEAGYGISYDAFVVHRLEVEQAMNVLLNDVGADAVLLTFGGGLLTWVGGLDQLEAESISRAIIHGWRTSAEVARILGREQVRFEQSIAGGDYMLYALSVEVNAIMGVAVRGSAPLGLMRHHARATVDQIAQLCHA
ncbi:MAG: response regulator transcription factor [Anaerolineae bacterium]|nr:response regulator transcription factor [Anaerolineae bacterium]